MKPLMAAITLALLTSCGGGDEDRLPALDAPLPIVDIHMITLERTTGNMARLECAWNTDPPETPTMAAFIKWTFLEETIQGLLEKFQAHIDVSKPGQYTLDLDPGIPWNTTTATLYVKANSGNHQESISYQD